LLSIDILNTQIELYLQWLSSTGPYVHSAQATELRAVVEGMHAQLKELEPEVCFTFKDFLYMIRFMLKMCWSFAKNWASALQYGLWL
jgi:hypothetical protein